MLRIMVLSFLISFTYLSCNNIPDSISGPQRNAPSPGRSHTSTTISINDFPHDVGSWWIYRHYYGSPGTVTIRIVGKLSVSEHTSKYLWLETPENIIDTVTISGDTVSSQNEHDPLGHKIYVFPLKAGSSWANPLFPSDSGNFFYDSTHVDTTPSDVTAGKFTFHNPINIRSYMINHDWSIYNDRQFVPGIGIISSQYSQFGFESFVMRDYWMLLDYSIARKHP